MGILRAGNTALTAPVPAPATAAEWRGRISGLKDQLTSASALVAERRQARRTAAGMALLSGQGGDSITALEDLERDAERAADSLLAACELAEGKAQKLEAAAKEAAEIERQARRDAVIAELRQAAGDVDVLFVQTVEKLHGIEDLMTQLLQEGGTFSRSLKACVMRALLAHGMRAYIEIERYVGSVHHCRPLSEQFKAIGVKASPDGSSSEQFVTLSVGGDFPG